MTRRKRKTSDKSKTKADLPRVEDAKPIPSKLPESIENREDRWLQRLRSNPRGRHFPASSVEDSVHKDEAQVELDVKRSFTFSFMAEAKEDRLGWPAADICTLRSGLSKVITRVLRAHRSLNYYQGYHDIASIVILKCAGYRQENNEKILVIDHEKAYAILESLSVNHLRDYMTLTITPLLNHLRLVSAILEKADPALFFLIRRLSSSYTMSEGAFYDYTLLQALSSLLTFYAHDVLELERILRIWDYVMDCQSVLCLIYVYVSALMEREQDILSALKADNAEDLEADTLHTLISPKYLFDGLSNSRFDVILERAHCLQESFPIETTRTKGSTVDTWLERFCESSVLMNTSLSKTNIDNEGITDNDDFGEYATDLETILDRQNHQAIQQERHDTEAQLEAIRRASHEPTRDMSLSSLRRLIGSMNKMIKVQPITSIAKRGYALSYLYRIGILVGVVAFAAAYIVPRGPVSPIRFLLGGIIRSNRRIFSGFERAVRDITNMANK